MNQTMTQRVMLLSAAAALILSTGDALAGDASNDKGSQGGVCAGLPSHAALETALKSARGVANGGFNLDMWGSVVNRDGIVCAVAFTGDNRGSQWPGSRVISAQKANTANAFSLPLLALSTANLWSAVQPGGSLYGLQHSNPVDTETAYRGPAQDFGEQDDPMVGRRIGGVNVFGGGLALYNSRHQLIGAIGVSGDTSCADHNIAWRTRNNLNLDYVPSGTSRSNDDNINYVGRQDAGTLANDFTHPICKIKGTDGVSQISEQLPAVKPRQPNS